MNKNFFILNTTVEQESFKLNTKEVVAIIF